MRQASSVSVAKLSDDFFDSRYINVILETEKCSLPQVLDDNVSFENSLEFASLEPCACFTEHVYLRVHVEQVRKNHEQKEQPWAYFMKIRKKLNIVTLLYLKFLTYVFLFCFPRTSLYVYYLNQM